MMAQLITRQIALMILLASSLIIVLLVLASGLDIDLSAVYTQAAPLAIICAAAFTIIVLDPFDARS